jgi:hypothetical protein
MTPVFLDANVFIYSAGRDHPLKAPSLQVLRLTARYRTGFVTDAEVFQEILHRSLASQRWNSMRREFGAFLTLMENCTESITPPDVSMAAELVDRYPTVVDRYPAVAARDLLHVAVMQRIGCSRIATADSDFDSIPNIERLDPMRVSEWAHLVTDAS